MAARTQQNSTALSRKFIQSAQKFSPGALSATTDKPFAFAFAGLDRKAMEQERLIRLGKRKRVISPEPQSKVELFNPRQGHLDSWQLGESVDDFVKRIHPLTTSALTCNWIWVENPHHNPGNKSTYPRVEHFTIRGLDLLEQSLQNRQAIQASGLPGAKGMLTKLLNAESKTLQQRIAELAAADQVVSGKVSCHLH